MGVAAASEGLAEDLGLRASRPPSTRPRSTFLAGLDVPAFKIASFELVDLPLIRQVAQTGKPMIMSTGMATQDEVDEAVTAARSAGATEIALLKCTSAYPSPAAEVSLRAIPAMQARWGLPVGLSDHTSGSTMPVAAVALGACIVEKHIMLSHDDPTLDAAFSLDVEEFRSMVRAIRDRSSIGGSAGP